MKTKAYKLRENIARFIYEKLKGKGCRIEVFWDRCACIWLVRTKGFISQELVDEVQHTANFLGIDISLAEPDKLCTKMWNKKKEFRTIKKEHEKMCKELFESVDDFSKKMDITIGKMIEKGVLKIKD